MSAYWTSSISPSSAQRAPKEPDSKITSDVPGHLAASVDPQPAIVKLSTFECSLVPGETVPKSNTLTLEQIPDSQPPSPGRGTAQHDTDSARVLGPEPGTRRRDSESAVQHKEVDQCALLPALEVPPRPCRSNSLTKPCISSYRWLARPRSVSAYSVWSPPPSRDCGVGSVEGHSGHASGSVLKRARRACNQRCPIWLGFLATIFLVGGILLVAFRHKEYAHFILVGN